MTNKLDSFVQSKEEDNTSTTGDPMDGKVGTFAMLRLTTALETIVDTHCGQVCITSGECYEATHAAVLAHCLWIRDPSLAGPLTPPSTRGN